MVERNFTCDSCFILDFNWWQFVKEFSSTTFCLEPAGYVCRGCFLSAFLLRLHVEVMFSLPLTHLGTAFASGLFRGNNTLVEKFYRKLSGTNSTSYPPELVANESNLFDFIIFNNSNHFFQIEILNTAAEAVDTDLKPELSSMLVSDARTNICWGSGFMKTTNLSYESVPKCCSDKTACDLGTFQSIFYVMKESMGQPHTTDFDWNYKDFTGLLGSNTLKSDLSCY